MIDNIIQNLDISTLLNSVDWTIIVCVCVVVEVLKTTVIKSDRFKAFCPFAVAIFSIVASAGYAIYSKGQISAYAVKGLMDGGIAALAYDAIISKVKGDDSWADTIATLFGKKKEEAKEIDE